MQLRLSRGSATSGDLYDDTLTADKQNLFEFPLELQHCPGLNLQGFTGVIAIRPQ